MFSSIRVRLTLWYLLVFGALLAAFNVYVYSSLAIDLRPLPSQAVVADLVYVPLETALLAAARARGLRTADGLGMLLHQAVRGFELWFGQRPQVTPELRALVEADLVKACVGGSLNGRVLGPSRMICWSP